MYRHTYPHINIQTLILTHKYTYIHRIHRHSYTDTHSHVYRHIYPHIYITIYIVYTDTLLQTHILISHTYRHIYPHVDIPVYTAYPDTCIYSVYRYTLYIGISIPIYIYPHINIPIYTVYPDVCIQTHILICTHTCTHSQIYLYTLYIQIDIY